MTKTLLTAAALFALAGYTAPVLAEETPAAEKAEAKGKRKGKHAKKKMKEGAAETKGAVEGAAK